ncbi:MAG: HU family DNA-binding protein [Phycisphaerales bacterium]
MATTTKREITERVAKTTNQHRDVVRSVIQSFLDEVIEELSRGNRLEFRDFGVFEVRERAARTAQNPKTLVQVPVPARRAVRFKAGRLMKERVEHPVSTLGRG